MYVYLSLGRGLGLMTKLFSINVPIELHRELRLIAAEKDTTMTEIVINAIKNELGRLKASDKNGKTN